MSASHTYLLIDVLTIAGPLVLSFDKKVAYHKKWKFLWPGMLLTALFFLAWDGYFTYKGVWWFRTNYLTGIRLLNLPIEEALFFFAIPFSCVFIYECVKAYFRFPEKQRWPLIFLKVFATVLILAGVGYHDRDYTSWTFLGLGFFLWLILWKQNCFLHFNPLVFLVSFVGSLVPFFIVDGLLTGSWVAQPIVNYNDAETLGFRLGTIPVEDIFYGMLLVLMNITFLEMRQKQRG